MGQASLLDFEKRLNALFGRHGFAFTGNGLVGLSKLSNMRTTFSTTPVACGASIRFRVLSGPSV